MASKPGPLTDWPWHFLSCYKYTVLLPLMGHAVRSLYWREEKERDYGLLFPYYLLLSRLIHDQLWITLARFQNGRSKHRIQSRSIDFQQVDRERGWDDQAIFHCIIFYAVVALVPQAKQLPAWNTSGAIALILSHVGPVEFVYYWAHRALHHHFLYSRYHSHHHASFITEPITSVVHPFAEHLLYVVIFAIPIIVILLMEIGSIAVIVGYITWVDAMNNLGHCNFEFVPMWAFKVFPFLKYLIYTPSYHSLHHSQVHTNFSLFMPIYDYMYGTIDKNTDPLYEKSLIGRAEKIDVVHLTHPTSLDSIYHLRLGFASLASQPYASKWYLWVMWPVSTMLMVLMWTFGFTFTVEKNRLNEFQMQTWAIPRYSFHYSFPSQRKVINGLIEKAILEADAKGVKVMSLGLLNQSEELNKNGEIYLHNHENFKIRVVDGNTLAAAVVLNTVPQEASQVLIAGQITKACSQVILALCKRGTQVIILSLEEFKKMKLRIPIELQDNLIRASSSNRYKCKIWVVGDEFGEREQRRASKGTVFIPFSMFPLKATRKDCIYHSTPSMLIPDTLENVHSCENWLPRRIMSAWRVSGILHALEGWDSQECGDMVIDMEKVWNAALRHGFRPVKCEQIHASHFD